MSPAASTRQSLCAIAVLMVLSGCHDSPPHSGDVAPPKPPADNPLVAPASATAPVPPFDRIAIEHLVPALDWTLEAAEPDLRRAAGGAAQPDFDSTILPLIRAEARVNAVAGLALGLDAAGAWAGHREVLDRFEQRLAEHRRRVLADHDLYTRIDQLYDRLDVSGLGAEEQRLVAEIRRQFRLAGADLGVNERQRLNDVTQRLSALEAEYRQRLMAATHEPELLITDPTRLEALPVDLVAEARQNAADRGHAMGWAFTLHAHSFYPFMRHFPDREARRTLYQARMHRYRDLRRSDADLGGLIERLAEMRARRAAALGFDSHLDLMMADASLGNRDELERLLGSLQRAASWHAQVELDQLEAIARSEGIDLPLQPWDWWYYRARLDELQSEPAAGLTARFDFVSVRNGLFVLAERLWGLRFTPRDDLPRWHDSVEAFEVSDAAGEHLGLLYIDPFHRRGKRGGAWMSRFQNPSLVTAEASPPVVAIVTNLPAAAAGGGDGLRPEHVRALFHEFGHALHALLSDVGFEVLAGTHVAPDFVEFPALTLERLAFEPSLVAQYARPGPGAATIEPPRLSALARQGHPTPALELLERLAAVRLDLAMHGAPTQNVPDLVAAERSVRRQMDLPEIVSPRHHGGGLDSLFAGQRHGGDFRSLWSDLLAAEAVERLRGPDGLSGTAAAALREEVLARGNSRPPLESWQAFSGGPPLAEPLLRALGLPQAQTEEETLRSESLWNP